MEFLLNQKLELYVSQEHSHQDIELQIPPAQLIQRMFLNFYLHPGNL